MMRDLLYYRRPTLITTVERLLQELVEAGIDTLVLAPEMGDFRLSAPGNCQELKQLLDTYRIKTPAIHGLFRHRYDLNSEDAEFMTNAHCSLLNNVSLFGVKTYVVHCGLPIAGRAEAQEWDAIRRAVSCILPTAEKHDIIVAVENLPPDYIGNHPDPLIDLVEGFDSPHLRLCFDSGHAHMCGDAGEYLDRMSPYVVTMHLHDNDGLGDRHLSPGDGTLDWTRLVPVIKRCPNLVHMEVESFNREGRSHSELWALYNTVLGDTAKTGIAASSPATK